jgi:hypothetical protein
MTKFLVSGGDFFRTEGILSIVELDDNTGQLSLISENWINHPDDSLSVIGKGFTGLCLDGELAWTCFSNMVVAIDLETFSIVNEITDPYFNDLHHLELIDGTIFVANSGNESVDRISLSDGAVVRIDLLGSNLRSMRPENEQTEDTKPHLHHVSSVTLNSHGDVIIGMVRQSRILNISKWEWIGPRMSSPVHDVQCNRTDTVWCTTVSGRIHKFSPEGTQTTFDLGDYQSPVGWTRGLAVTEKGCLVGTTAIRESNHDYFSSFSKELVGHVGSKLTWIPFDNALKSSSLVLPNPATRKIFSICCLEDSPIG